MKILKKFLILILIAVFSGCASSERMSRMSGGIIGEYSLPKSQRLRSEKYKKISNEYSSQQIKQRNLAGINDSLINLWPAFYRSKDYFSIFWPIFDKDPFGMAIRPIYNQEGNDFSILFPLSSWNPEEKRGWILNASWRRNSFGFFPFYHWEKTDSKEETTIFPLFSETKSTYSGSLFDRDRFYSRNYLILAHCSTRETKDLTNERWANLSQLIDSKRYASDIIPRLKYEKEIGNFNYDIPKNINEFKNLCRNEAEKLPDTKLKNYGIFPLFNKANLAKDSSRFSLLAGLYLSKTTKQSTRWEISPFNIITHNSLEFTGLDIFTTILHYENETISKKDLRNSADFFFYSFPIPFYLAETTTYSPDDERITAIKNLRDEAEKTRFSVKSETTVKMLGRISSDLKLPQSVTNGKLTNLFLDDYCVTQKFATAVQKRSHGIWPIYNYGFSSYGKNSYLIMPLLLTGVEKNPKSYSFMSLPLLSYYFKDETGHTAAFLWPLAYHSKARKEERIHKRIYDSKTLWVDDNDCFDFRDNYFMLGLGYAGKQGFSVAKKDVPHDLLESVRQGIAILQPRVRYENNRLANYNKRLNDAKAMPEKDKFDFYRKQLKLEDLRKELVETNKKLTEFTTATNEFFVKCEKLGLPCPKEALTDTKIKDEWLNQLFDKFTEPRSQADYGTGFFYRKQLFYNGDYNWKYFLNVAAGAKKGNQKSIHILHFIYNRQEDENRSETTVFPFITMQKDGKDSKFSFMWRIFETTKKDGKRSGHFLFIPW